MGNLTGGLLDPLEWQKPRWHHLLFYFCGYALGASLSYLLVLKDTPLPFDDDGDDNSDEADMTGFVLLLSFFLGFPFAQCSIGMLGNLCFDLLLLNRIRGCDGMSVEGSCVTSNFRTINEDGQLTNHIKYCVIITYEITIPLVPLSLDDGEEKYVTRKYRQQEPFDKLPLWAANDNTSVIALRVLKSDVAYATVVEHRHCDDSCHVWCMVLFFLTLGIGLCFMGGFFTSLPVSIWFFQQLIWGCVLFVCFHTSPRKYELEEEYVERMTKQGIKVDGPMHPNSNDLEEPNELEEEYMKRMIKKDRPTLHEISNNVNILRNMNISK
jgi:hypothetical protein